MNEFDIEDKNSTKKLVTLEQAKRLDQVGYDNPVIVMYKDNGSPGGVFTALKNGDGDFILLTNSKLNRMSSMGKANNSYQKHYRAPFKWDALHWLEKVTRNVVLFIPIGDNYVYPVISSLEKPLDLVDTIEKIEGGMTLEKAIDHALDKLLDLASIYMVKDPEN